MQEMFSVSSQPEKKIRYPYARTIVTNYGIFEEIGVTVVERGSRIERDTKSYVSSEKPNGSKDR